MNKTSFFKTPHWLQTICFLLLSTAGSLFSQDTHFSQFYMSPLTQNPAMTGALYDMQAYLNYRNQWQSVTTPYRTMAASYDMRMNKKKNKKALNIGAIRTGSQFNGSSYDGSLPTGETLNNSSVSYFDAGAGLVWTYNNNSGAIKVTDNRDLRFNFGVALFHPNQPEYSFYNDGEKLFMKYVIHGSALVSVPNTNIAFVPSFFYCMQGPSRELYAGSLVRYKLKQDSKYTGRNKGSALSLGAFYRAGDGVAAAFLLEYSNYAIGLSYDINSSPLQSASHFRGGTEITLRFVNPNPFFN
jgi:hypothetical protein